MLFMINSSSSWRDSESLSQHIWFLFCCTHVNCQLFFFQFWFSKYWLRSNHQEVPRSMRLNCSGTCWGWLYSKRWGPSSVTLWILHTRLSGNKEVKGGRVSCQGHETRIADLTLRGEIFFAMPLHSSKLVLWKTCISKTSNIFSWAKKSSPVFSIVTDGPVRFLMVYLAEEVGAFSPPIDEHLVLYFIWKIQNHRNWSFVVFTWQWPNNTNKSTFLCNGFSVRKETVHTTRAATNLPGSTIQTQIYSV